MKPDFHGRINELAALEKAYQSSSGSFVPVYGRRRVGKSRLISEFVSNKPSLSFVGKRATGTMQMKEFLERAAAAHNEPLLAQIAPTTWLNALDAAVSRWKGNTRFVLVLDEFQWIAEYSPDIMSALQQLWDEKWQYDAAVMLVICGSYVGFMEREVLGKKSPLFGRRTAQLLVRPFGYREAALFHPTYTVEDRARTYFICGGIPLYLSFFKASRSVEENIAANLLDQFSPMFNEPDFLLREELREVEKYHTVLMALADNRNTISGIAEFSGISVRVLPYYLRSLRELGYIGRRAPLTGERPNARVVRYVLRDPLLRFWFRFIFPHQSLMLAGENAAPMLALIRRDLDSYFGSCFESLCREALAVSYAKRQILTRFEIGEYWDKNIQIDVVGVREDNRIDLGECKWGKSGAPGTWTQELQRKAEAFTNPKNASLGQILFTRKKIEATSVPNHVSVYSLDDLYGF